MPKATRNFCAGIITQGKRLGEPCRRGRSPGHDYCWRHLGQRPLNEEAEAVLAVLEPEFVSRFPGEMGRYLIGDLRQLARADPAILADLSAAATLPDDGIRRAAADLASQLRQRLAPAIAKAFGEAASQGRALAIQPHPVRVDTPAIAANHPSDHVLRLALVLTARWETNKDEGHKFFEGRSCTVKYRPTELFPDNWHAAKIREQALALLEDRFKKMKGDLVADVLDVLFLHWYNNGRGKVGITLSQVLKYRGVQIQTKTLHLHWRAMRDARCLRLQGLGIEDAAVVDMDAARLPKQPNLFGAEEPPAADVIYVYSPGAFLAAALSENREYLAAYIPKLLHLDPYRDNLAKRMGRYLRSDWRMNARGYLNGYSQFPRYRTWRDHLADAGIVLGGMFPGRPGDLIDALDRDMKELHSIGAIGEWPQDPKAPGGWLYHPDDQERRMNLPPVGKLEAFLSLRIHLPPPQDIADWLKHYAKRQSQWETKIQALATANAARKLSAATRKADLRTVNDCGDGTNVVVSIVPSPQ